MILILRSVVGFVVLNNLLGVHCDAQFGPDPWQNNNKVRSHTNVPDVTVPPDLMPVQHTKRTFRGNGVGDWFYKRLLAIFLKGGKIVEAEDNVEITTNMKLTREQWSILNNYIKSSKGLSEDMYRKSVGFIEEGLYKPTITDKAVTAWTNIQLYLNLYKIEIFYTVSILAFLASSYTLWNLLSSRQIKIILFILIYIYEVFISYKEAEQKEYEKFMLAVKNCSWVFWSSNCDVPQLDLILFLKHMHPLRIAMRLLTSIISEPIVVISSTVNEIIGGITSTLWFPFNKIVSGFLLIFINLTWIMLLTMLLFNYILNVPFKLSFLAGLISFGVTQRNRTIIEPITETPTNNSDDRISGSNLNNLLTIIANTYKEKNKTVSRPFKGLPLKKSARVGRLTNSEHKLEALHCQPSSSKRDKKHNSLFTWRVNHLGGGDSK